MLDQVENNLAGVWIKPTLNYLSSPPQTSGRMKKVEIILSPFLGSPSWSHFGENQWRPPPCQHPLAWKLIEINWPRKMRTRVQPSGSSWRQAGVWILLGSSFFFRIRSAVGLSAWKPSSLGVYRILLNVFGHKFWSRFEKPRPDIGISGGEFTPAAAAVESSYRIITTSQGLPFPAHTAASILKDRPTNATEF